MTTQSHIKWMAFNVISGLIGAWIGAAIDYQAYAVVYDLLSVNDCSSSTLKCALYFLILRSIVVLCAGLAALIVPRLLLRAKFNAPAIIICFFGMLLCPFSHIIIGGLIGSFGLIQQVILTGVVFGLLMAVFPRSAEHAPTQIGSDVTS